MPVAPRGGRKGAGGATVCRGSCHPPGASPCSQAIGSRLRRNVAIAPGVSKPTLKTVKPRALHFSHAACKNGISPMTGPQVVAQKSAGYTVPANVCGV
jgi:hypothetical protein